MRRSIHFFIVNFFLFLHSAIGQNLTKELYYRNPIIYSDYSDPDVIRVGSKYIMTASSFNHTPGLPILTSNDMVHWDLVGHALPKLVPESYYSSVRHGGGVWAPAIRFHNNQYYIYYPDPDFGIYMIHSKKITGPWSSPLLVISGKGLIDPCPFWDDNGKVYLIHAYAGSRAGIKSLLVMKELNKEGTNIVNEGSIVYDGHVDDPTIEGPKLYKQNGFYYIFAPAGGVSTGWQTVLRSKNIYGPYERRVVMNQGGTDINGPHQGAWIKDKNQKDWFIHFQDRGVYGRVVHLQPMKWNNDWPLIGEDVQHNGIGQPVIYYPGTNAIDPINKISSSQTDSFSGCKLNNEWQWQANPCLQWSYLNGTSLRLYTAYYQDSLNNLYNVPQLLMKKFESESFEAITKVLFTPNKKNDKCGIIVFGYDYAWIGLEKKDSGVYIVQSICKKADQGNEERQEVLTNVSTNQSVYLKVSVAKEGICSFGYSTDGIQFFTLPNQLHATQGKWVGAKVGLFAHSNTKTNDCGYADFDWFTIKK